MRKLLLPLLVVCLTACNNKDRELDDLKPYEGPIMEMAEVETLFSDSAVVRVKLEAASRKDFKNGNSEFPEGIYLEFYGPDSKITSTLKADQGFYKADEDIYHALGDVVVVNENNEKLNTEELFWKPAEERVFTEKFVRIESDGQLLLGEGLNAAQDFSTYEILKPTATVDLEGR